MIKNLQLLMVAICSPLFLFGQETTLTIPKVPLIRVSDVYTDFGGYNTNFGLVDKSMYRKLAPASNILKGDFSGLVKSGVSEDAGVVQSLSIGLKIRNKEKTGYRKNMQVRLGVHYYSDLYTNVNYRKTDRVPYDTLVSGQTGAVIYRDSINEQGIRLNHSAEQIRISAAIYFSTESTSRWMFYGGVGASVGSTLKNYTTLSSYEYSYLEYENDMPAQERKYKLNEYEEYLANNTLAWSVFSTAGIDFRIGKKRKFWQPIHLFTEFKPTFDMVNDSYGFNQPNVQITSCFGLRYQIQQ